MSWLTLEGKFQRLFSCSCSLRGCSRGKQPILAAPACVTEPRSWRAGEPGPRACVSEWGSFQIRPRLGQSTNRKNTVDLKSVEPLEADFINIDIYLPHTCMKNPASRALLMLWVLVLVPKEGSEMGSSILFRVSVNSDRMASAVFREEQSRKLSWHHFSALKSETYSEIALWLNSDTPWNSIGKQFLWKNYI